jgi:glycosyltransferase involved in cell wall biosynthesis
MNKPKIKETRDKRLKILHIAGWYPSKKNLISGIFVQEHVNATALYNDVAVLYSEGMDKGIRNPYQIEDNIEDGKRTLRICYKKSPIPKTSYFIYLWAMFQAFGKLSRKGFMPDVIHAHMYLAGVPAVLLGMKYGIPVVVTEQSSEFSFERIRGFSKLKAKFAFEKASLVCPVSESLKKHIKAYDIRAQFCVVPNVVETFLFTPTTVHDTRKDSRKRLLVVALLDPKKGIPYLLKALAQLKENRNDFVLDIVGDGPKRSEYEEQTRKLGLSNIVTFYGLKTKKEVVKFMKKCDIFVLPSPYETFGVVLIEALACGKPVIASDIGGPKEIITMAIGSIILVIISRWIVILLYSDFFLLAVKPLQALLPGGCGPRNGSRIG